LYLLISKQDICKTSGLTLRKLCLIVGIGVGIKLKLHFFDLLWIVVDKQVHNDPQQINLEFELNGLRFRVEVV